MSLANLQIQNVRNIRSAKFNFHPHLNFIVGANGSGKTSLLEAIYLLGTGHSFRTREISPLISKGSENLTVFARTFDEQSISIQKSLSSSTQVRLNGNPCQTSSELAYFLPCQIFYQDLFQIIDAGPSVRRNLLDWGLFHVERSYHQLLKDYKRVLRQRNSLLKQGVIEKNFIPWNKTLSLLAERLDDFRSSYFQKLENQFSEFLTNLNIDCNLSYYKGWDRKGTNKSLEEIYIQSFSTDIQRQFTHYGAHQADIDINANHFKAKQYLSRGQQKMVLFALKMAQTYLMSKSCLFLCDDLPTELDNYHLDWVFELINTTKGQFFITLINEDLISNKLNKDSYCIFSLN